MIEAEDFAFWPPPNVREKCNDKKSKGIRLIYKPDDGYTGDDKTNVLAISPDSTAYQYIFNIHVW